MVRLYLAIAKRLRITNKLQMAQKSKKCGKYQLNLAEIRVHDVV